MVAAHFSLTAHTSLADTYGPAMCTPHNQASLSHMQLAMTESNKKVTSDHAARLILVQ